MDKKLDEKKQNALFELENFNDNNFDLDIKNYNILPVKREDVEKIIKELKTFLRRKKDKNIRNKICLSVAKLKKIILQEEKSTNLDEEVLDAIVDFLDIQKDIENSKKVYGIRKNEIKTDICVEQEWSRLQTLMLAYLLHFHPFDSLRAKNYELQQANFVPNFYKKTIRPYHKKI